MEDNTTKEEETERERLVWKTRELLLRNRAIQAQLKTAHQENKATQMISSATKESIKSTNDELHARLMKEQEQLLSESQVKLEQLSDKLNLAKCQIFKRSKELIRELWDIYPIIEFPDRKGYSICDIHLPSSEHFEGHDETMVSVAIGYVGHLLLLLGEFLDITLRFPLRYYGSKSLIYCSRKNQLFPLYLESFKSREVANFSYGMGLLNLNIVQMRTLYGLPTKDPDDTLANLHGLRLLFDNDD